MSSPAKPLSERALEDVVVDELVARGYSPQDAKDFDRSLGLDPEPLVGFIQATQPKMWRRFCDNVGGDARDVLLKRVARAVRDQGVTHIVRRGVRANGCTFELAAFKPESSRNPDTLRLYRANRFTVVRQLRYDDSAASIDLAIFLNGLPLATAELKNPFNGQSVQHAIAQYRRDRVPGDTILAHGRCVAHFAVDPMLVYVTTHLRGGDTRFLPFNRGRGSGTARGAGNPIPRPGNGFATAYLWRDVWSPDNVLEWMQSFVQDSHTDDEGRRRRTVIFPRYHQWSAVRKMVGHAAKHGTGRDYLIQHSAGSGKSNSIAWLAHRLSSLQVDDARVFDTVIVVTDRIALDRQLSQTVSSFEQTAGLVTHVGDGGELKDALSSGKPIIVTTLQKFPVVLQHVRAMEDQWRRDSGESDAPATDADTPPAFYRPGSRTFALILDEAHSSQGGEASKEMRRTLVTDADAEDNPDGDLTPLDMAAADQQARGKLQTVSTFAFTATPKPRTLELFGTATAGAGQNAADANDANTAEAAFAPFDLYSMRQAIEEGFILDVLQNYTSYHTQWTLAKTIREDPNYDPQKASRLLTRLVTEDPKTIEQRIPVIVGHVNDVVLDAVDGRGRAMLVTSSRRAAVMYKRMIDEHLRRHGHRWETLVAFSGKVTDEATGLTWTEGGMNGCPESQTAARFADDPVRLLIVANKFQTGFDQPLLHTMYVDKKLSGVPAVQTLSRLNRIAPGKTETCVIDFVGSNPDRVREAFGRYYDATKLRDATDPNEVYTLEGRMRSHGLFFDDDVDRFAATYYTVDPKQADIYASLTPIVHRYQALPEGGQQTFRTDAAAYVDLYAFLGQILRFSDPDLETTYQFARMLLKILPVPTEQQPWELKRHVQVETVRLRRQNVDLRIPGDQGTLKVAETGAGGDPAPPPDAEPLSEILRRLNERFGTLFGGEGAEEFLGTLEDRLDADAAMAASLASSTSENARLTFDHRLRDHVQDMIDTNFEFYKQINDQPEFAEFLGDLLFDRYQERRDSE